MLIMQIYLTEPYCLELFNIKRQPLYIHIKPNCELLLYYCTHRCHCWIASQLQCTWSSGFQVCPRSLILGSPLWTRNQQVCGRLVILHIDRGSQIMLTSLWSICPCLERSPQSPEAFPLKDDLDEPQRCRVKWDSFVNEVFELSTTQSSSCGCKTTLYLWSDPYLFCWLCSVMGTPTSEMKP